MTVNRLIERLGEALEGRYRVFRELGSGGMATVFLAEDLKHGRQVALKVLDPEVAAAVGAERFLREIETTARLRHPHILPLHDSGEAGGLLYYVMPHVSGGSLADRLAREKQLPIEEAVRFAAEIAEALEAAHAEGVIHRDIKPENVLLEGGHAIVADFGVAGLAERAGVARLTRVGAAIGTPAFMSPEQVAGEDDLDGRSDQYSVGCVLYYMLTGSPPFTGTGQTVARQQLAADPQPVSVVRPRVPEPVGEVVKRAMQKLPADRFPTAAAMAQALRAGIGAGAGRRVFPRWSVPAAGVAGLALVVALVVRSLGGDGPIDSVAVLPFENASSDPDGEYLSVGLTENLIDRLTGIEDLRVVPRGVVFGYEGGPSDTERARSELGVRALVTGRVREIDGRIVVRAELTDVGARSHLWGQEYDRPVDDIFELQADLAREISAELRSRLSPDVERALTTAPSESPEAYRLALRSRYHTLRTDREGVLRGLDFAEQAVELDPTYALGWVVLADAHMAGGFHGVFPHEDAWSLARAAARRAIELAPDLPEAIVELAIVRWFADWEFEQARRDVRRALELDPDNVDALAIGGMMLCADGQFDEALAWIDRSLELDPFTPDIVDQKTGCLGFAGRHQEALAYFDGITIYDADDLGHHLERPALLQAVGRHDDAIELLEELLRRSGAEPESTLQMAIVRARAGQTDEARAIAGRVDLNAAGPLAAANLWTALGETELALDALDQALAARARLMPFLGVSPVWDSLRDEERFEDLLSRIGIGR